MTWPYLVRLDVADHVANSPCDTLAKRVIASNLDHLANSHGQMLVNWASADSSGVQRTATASGNVVLWQSASFTLKLRPNGTHYPIRIRLRGRRTTAGTCTFFVYLNGDTASIASYACSSTTGAWLTAGDDGLITSTPEYTSSLVRNIAAPITLAGATIAYPEALATIHVRCSIANGSTAELTGLHAQEVIGV